jgi:hypothetical protein
MRFLSSSSSKASVSAIYAASKGLAAMRLTYFLKKNNKRKIFFFASYSIDIGRRKKKLLLITFSL